MTRSLTLDALEPGSPGRERAVALPQAQRYVRRFTRAHSENFSVLSALLPRAYRQPFAAIYAFCRFADDLADEATGPARSLELLGWWQRELDRCFQGDPRHPIFVALSPVIERCELPRAPFDDLLAAFRQDQQVQRYDTWASLLAYCECSANPVGRLVLCLCGCRAPRQWARSDATCTALQLTNFWQDVRRDLLERRRIYIPRDVAERYGLDLEALAQSAESPEDAAEGLDRLCNDPSQASAYRATVRELVERTWPLFAEGRSLWPALPGEMRRPIQLFTLGGEAVLRSIERSNYQTWQRRPRLGRAGKLMLLVRALLGRV
jgi:squalene synthase HpnC